MKEAALAVKQYRSHCRISMTAEIQALVSCEKNRGNGPGSDLSLSSHLPG